MVDRLSNRTGNFANSNAISNFIEWQGRGQPLPTMGQQAPAAGPPAQAQAAASPGTGAGRLFYTRGIFRERGANPRTLGRLDNPRPGGRAGANPSSSRGADRRTASQKFPRNSGRGSVFFQNGSRGAGRQAGGVCWTCWTCCNPRRGIMQRRGDLGRDQRRQGAEYAGPGRWNCQK